MAKFIKVFDAASGSSHLLKNAITVTTDAAIMADTTTAQTFTNKTLTSPTITGATSTITVASLAGLGSTIADAAPIVTSAPAVIFATGANASVGILLPIAAAGKVYKIKNDQAANAVMKVYAQVNSTINGLSANTAISMAANTCCEFIGMNTTGWVTLPLLPS